MARTATAEQHRHGQAALAVGVAPLVFRAWGSLFDRHDLKGSSPRLVAAVEAILRRYGRAAAAAALTTYRNQRREAGVPGRVSLKMPPLPTHDELTAAVEHVLTPLYGPPDATAERNAQDALSSEVEQMVLDQGRDAIIRAVQQDKAAKGWARVTEPGACYFCAMLATRGAVYRSESTANFRAHTKQPNGTGGTCRCHAEPVFSAYEPTAQIRQWQADYKRLKDEHGGSLSLIQWRRAFEGRDGTDRQPLG